MIVAEPKPASRSSKRSLVQRKKDTTDSQSRMAQTKGVPEESGDPRIRTLRRLFQEVKSLYQQFSSSVPQPLLKVLQPEVESFIAGRLEEVQNIKFDDSDERKDWFDTNFLPFMDKVMDVMSGLEWEIANGKKEYQHAYQSFYDFLFGEVNEFCKDQQWFLFENIKVGTLFNPRHHQGAGSEMVEEPFFNKIIHVKKLGLMNLSGIQRIRKAHVIVGN